MSESEGAVDVDEVVRAVEGCPSVARMAAGAVVEVATYLPGRRVPGVRLGDDVLEVHVVACYGQALPDVADEIRRALVDVVGRRRIAVFIDDLDLDLDTDLEPAEGGRRG